MYTGGTSPHISRNRSVVKLCSRYQYQYLLLLLVHTFRLIGYQYITSIYYYIRYQLEYICIYVHHSIYFNFQLILLASSFSSTLILKTKKIRTSSCVQVLFTIWQCPSLKLYRSLFHFRILQSLSHLFSHPTHCMFPDEVL